MLKEIKYSKDYCSHHGFMRPCRTCMQDVVNNTTKDVEKVLENEHRIIYRQEIVTKANISISNAFTQEYRDAGYEFESLQWKDQICLKK